ncbi:MAG: polysaccharide deacetylase family protein [Ktedonobacteraceae bacterium]|nr:polysaccharide deacetylase family protein [Ktedonobacteraceae bacterium]
MLTFDDGFADFYSEAFPVLRRYRFVATLYIVTAFVGNTSCWLVREGEASRPMLTWEQLAEISAYGIECGGHTQSHPQLDLLPRDRAREEIVRCKEALENHLNCAVGSFAYPFGYYSVGVRRLVQEAGYTSACAVRYAMSSESDDPYALARLIVKNDTSIEAFASLLSGQGVSSVFTLYKALQAPLWRTARRSVALAVHSFQKGVFLQ